MKKVFIIFLCCIVFCGCRKQENDDFDLNKFIDEKYDFIPTKTPIPSNGVMLDSDDKYYDYLFPTNTPKPTKKAINVNVEFEQNGQTFLDYEDGELVGKVRIDDIIVETKDYDYMERLNIYFVGEVLECTENIYIKYKLFDEEGYVIDDDYLKIDGLCAGDKFKNKYIIYDANKLKNYKIELFDNPD